MAITEAIDHPHLGPNATGTRIYTDDGSMCVMLMRLGRKAWSHEEETATEAEKAEAGSESSAYCGIYSVGERAHIVMHLTTIAFVPDLVGAMQKCPFQLEGDRLTFSGRELAGPRC